MGLKEILSHKQVYIDTNIIIYLIEGFEPYTPVLDDIASLLAEDKIKVFTTEFTFCEL